MRAWSPTVRNECSMASGPPDFYSPYGPGVSTTAAAAYRLFGTRLLVERWVTALLLIAVGGLSYVLLARRRGKRAPPETGGSGDAAAPGSMRRDVPAAADHGAAYGSARTRFGRWQALREIRHLIIAGLAALTVVLLLASGWWYTPVNGGILALVLLSGLALQQGLGDRKPGMGGSGRRGGGDRDDLAADVRRGAADSQWMTWAVTVAGEPAEVRQQNRNLGLAAMAAAAVAIALPVYAGLIAAGGRRSWMSSHRLALDQHGGRQPAVAALQPWAPGR